MMIFLLGLFLLQAAAAAVFFQVKTNSVGPLIVDVVGSGKLLIKL